jgi:hypothetical protein
MTDLKKKLIFRWHVLKHEVFKWKNRFRAVNAIFISIHKNRYWGNGESVSGTGSNLAQTKVLVQALPRLMAKYQIRSVLDVPCGDFNWMQKIDFATIKYRGGDIVPDIIRQNRLQHPAVHFDVIDLLHDVLPAADLLICRDCLVHFSDKHIRQALDNIRKSQCQYLLTTTFPQKQNTPLVTGSWRPINLNAPPFNFPAALEMILEQCDESSGVYADKSLALWRIDDLPSS